MKRQSILFGSGNASVTAFLSSSLHSANARSCSALQPIFLDFSNFQPPGFSRFGLPYSKYHPFSKVGTVPDRPCQIGQLAPEFISQINCCRSAAVPGVCSSTHAVIFFRTRRNSVRQNYAATPASQSKGKLALFLRTIYHLLKAL